MREIDVWQLPDNRHRPLDFGVLTRLAYPLVKMPIVTERTKAQQKIAHASTETVGSNDVDGSHGR